MTPDPCTAVSPLANCSGPCWVIEMAEMYRRIDEDATTPEGQAFLKAIEESCVPYTEVVGFEPTPRQYKEHRFRLESML